MASEFSLRTEGVETPLGLTILNPRFSWVRNDSTSRQVSYRITLRTGEPPNELFWDSGTCAANESHLIEYVGPALDFRTRYYWQVTIITDEGREITSSESWFETGLDPVSDWGAQMIGLVAPNERHTDHRPCAYLQQTINLGEGPVRARLYATAAGLAIPNINGTLLDERLFRPGRSDYSKRLYVDTYDVTTLLAQGDNCWGAIVGEGWFAGPAAFESGNEGFALQTGWLARLEVEYASGNQEVFVTGPSFRGGFGPVRSSGIFAGECYDARFSLSGWCRREEGEPPGFGAVVTLPTPPGQRVGAVYPPIRRLEHIAPVGRSVPYDGSLLLDFGVNISGRVRANLALGDGQIVRLSHGEWVDPKGTLSRETLGGARCQDIVIGNGCPLLYEPTFTYRGFRHIHVEGLADPGQIVDLCAIPLSSGVTWPTSFTSSDPFLNDLFAAIRQTLRSNLFEVLTDCPQRNERLGWLGDSARFMDTACRLADLQSFLGKWCADMRDAQDSDGLLHPHAPVYHQPPSEWRTMSVDVMGARPGWSDGAVFIPWSAYWHYGDRRLLEESLPLMTGWVEYALAQTDADLIWRPEPHPIFNRDWLALDEDMPPAMFATAFLVRSAHIAALSAEAVGDKATYTRMQQWTKSLTAAWQTAFVDDGTLEACRSQGALTLALALELVPPARRDVVRQQLTASCAAAGRLTCGIQSIPYVLEELTRAGRGDLALALLRSDHHGSYRQWLSAGLTTIPELWDAVDPSGQVSSTWGNSLNHVAFGAVGHWLLSRIGGMRPTSPGWRTIVYEVPEWSGLDSCSLEEATPYGAAGFTWRRIGEDGFEVETLLPPGCRGELLKAGRTRQIEPGRTKLTLPTLTKK